VNPVSLVRPAVSADNHYDAVLTPPKHRWVYGLQSVFLPKDQHSFGVRRGTNQWREGAPTFSSICTGAN